jgi:YfiH family protein
VILWEDAPGPYEVVFSTREGGVSEGPYASLNLGRATADEPERVNENRRRLCAEVGAEPDALAMNYQHHSADVLRARAGSRGARGDGIWTDARGLPVLALAADCLPIALARANGSQPALALLHAGWRGLLEGIVPAGVSALGGGAVAAVVGPAIGPCCYEVGEDVADRFRRAFGFGLYRDGRLDLWTAAERALRAAGCVRVDRIDLCTACSPERFFSHRRDEGLTGRQGVIGHIG